MGNELLPEDLKWCLRRLPRKVLAMLKERHLFLAGGFIRACISSEPPSDVDLFAPTKEAAEAAGRALAGNDHRFFATENAYTVTGIGRLPIQFIHRWTYQSPSDLLPTFDFTVARAAIWWHDVGGWKTLCDERFYADLAAKRLVYCSPIRNEDAGGSMLRVLKFYQKGYRIPLDSLAAVVTRLVGGVKDIGAVFERGDVEVTRILTGLLHEVDPDIDPTHLAHLPATRGEETAGQAQEKETADGK